jgi:predicted RNA binding protein YcfA (HicA-like mRNA interferase family)
MEVIRVLQRAGFQLRVARGPHDVYFKPGRPPVSVPRHRGDLAKGTVRNIWQMAGLTDEEVEKLR